MNIAQIDYSSIVTTDSSCKGLNDGIVNLFLKTIEQNFTFDDQIVKSFKTTEGQKIYDQQQISFGNATICLVPYEINGQWSIIIKNSENIKNYSNVFESKYQNHSTYQQEDWQSGYTILILALQSLTKSSQTIDSNLIKKFRVLLKETIVNNVDALNFCHNCFKIPTQIIFCKWCSLSFCNTCLTDPFACSRC